MTKTPKNTRPPQPKIERLLIANRGEIACRIIRTARELGMETVAVFAEPDRDGAHVAAADAALPLGGDSPATSYLDIDRLLEAARRARADAVHPGYGFLAENAAFAAAVEQAGLCFIGPQPAAIAAMGDKIRARALAEQAGVPVIPAAPADDDVRRRADELGYPLLVKAAAGGGGRGMRLVREPSELEAALSSARREARAAFGDDRVYLERCVESPRHIEVQVFGDGKGGAVHFGERECSIQRRHQKVIEEAPSPFVDPELRAGMAESALRLVRLLAYRNAGTVEFIVDGKRNFYFLEMNTRLQVEHPVTELVTGTDLVRLQLELARGGALPCAVPEPRGHAIECRIYAEDPGNDFVPTGGVCVRVEQPHGVGIRVDSALYEGLEIPLEYDPLLAKICAWAPVREQAIRRMIGALGETAIIGVQTNISFLIDVLKHPEFRAGRLTTTFLETHFDRWRREIRDDACLALAAAVLALEHGIESRAGERPARGARATAWERLGRWRLGELRT